MTEETLQILPFYTGDRTLQTALQNPKSLRLLWLEVLFNDRVRWKDHLDRPEVRIAYEKACVWYGRYRTMIEGHSGKKMLERRPGDVDMREYRTFLEALHFVSGRS